MEAQIDPMELNLLHFLIVCPLVFLAGFVDAVAGGGGLISLPAYMLCGLPSHLAIGTNKISSSMGTALATWRYAQSGFIEWRLAPICVACAFAGSAGGAKLALLLDESLLKTLLLVILPLTGLYVLRSQSLSRQPSAQPAAPTDYRRTLRLAAMAALGIGVYDGFYGPGTGTFLILLLTGLAQMQLRQANGLTKVINLTTNLAAVSVFVWHGEALLPLGLTAGCFNMAGSYLGTRSFTKQGAGIAKPIILTVLLIFFIKTVWELI